MRLRTLKKIKNTLKENTNKAYKGITLQCEELHCFSVTSQNFTTLLSQPGS